MATFSGDRVLPIMDRLQNLEALLDVNYPESIVFCYLKSPFKPIITIEEFTLLTTIKSPQIGQTFVINAPTRVKSKTLHVETETDKKWQNVISSSIFDFFNFCSPCSFHHTFTVDISFVDNANAEMCDV